MTFVLENVIRGCFRDAGIVSELMDILEKVINDR